MVSRASSKKWLGWGLPLVWQGWAVFLLFFVLLIGGMIVLAPYGAVALITYSCVLEGTLLAVAFWKGEPQSRRDNSSP